VDVDGILWMVRWMDGWMDGSMARWLDGRTDGDDIDGWPCVWASLLVS